MPFPTTRKYPRTLQEAFPKDYMEWFYPPEKKNDYWFLPCLFFFIYVIAFIL